MAVTKRKAPAGRTELYELVDALPAREVPAARRYLEYLRDLSDPYAHLDDVDPFANMPDDERAKLHASLERAEREIEEGKGISGAEFLRELRALR